MPSRLLRTPGRIRMTQIKGRDGDRISAAIAANYNFSLLLR
jgi:hypothetical protein